MIARKRGFCGYCRAPWWPGDSIWRKGALITHKACMLAYEDSLSQYKKERQ